MEQIQATTKIISSNFTIPLTSSLLSPSSSSSSSSPTSSSSSFISLFSSTHELTDGYQKPLSKLLDETDSLYPAICLGILVAYKIIQYLVLGTLRVSENQHLREAFWDYSLQKSLFIVFILDAKTYEERMPWAIWSTILGSIALLSACCKDRFEYLSSSPTTKRWSLIKISILMGLLLLITIICNVLVFISRQYSTHTLFLLADSVYMLTFVLSVITKCLILTYDMRTNSVWENRASVIYYGDLIFAITMSTIDLLHHSHMLIISYTSFFIKGWCLVRINTLVLEIRRRYRRHKNYLLVVQLMDTNFPMASKEDIDKNSDDCAICWDEMDSARKLPCGHLFHNSCLRSWLEQDTSCPTCRTSLKRAPPSNDENINGVDDEIEENSESDEEFIETTIRTHQRNHFFHFDSSRYTNHPLLSWLPTISIEGFM